MAWVKTHPHLLTLILISLAILAGAGLLITQAKGFDSKFDPVRQPVTKGTKVYQQEDAEIQAATAEFKAPTTWKRPSQGRSLLRSEPYLVENGDLKAPGNITTPYWRTGDPIPNSWLMENGIPAFTKNVLRQDPDKDGFTSDEEWFYKTNPNNAESHPPYHALLFVQKYIRVPFLLKFQVWDGDPHKPETLSFQINTLSLRQPSVFLKIGAMVPNTKFKIEKFEEKIITTDNGVETDVSKLTVINTEDGSPVELQKLKVTDSPDSYALFTYKWNGLNKDIQVKKGQNFVLLPEKEQLYKLLDISDEKALIQTPSGEKIEIPKLPSNYPQ